MEIESRYSMYSLIEVSMKWINCLGLRREGSSFVLRPRRQGWEGASEKSYFHRCNRIFLDWSKNHLEFLDESRNRGQNPIRKKRASETLHNAMRVWLVAITFLPNIVTKNKHLSNNQVIVFLFNPSCYEQWTLLNARAELIKQIITITKLFPNDCKISKSDNLKSDNHR